MLSNIKIENIAVIKSADIFLGGGLNVLTGETGTGKSIIIDSVNAVLGQRTSRDLIRGGCTKGRVTAHFIGVGSTALAVLADMGIESDDELIIQRTLYNDGKNNCRVNGTPVTVAMLKTIGASLINIHGQHDNQTLLSPEKHYTYIDSLGSLNGLLGEYQEQFNLYKELFRRYKELDVDEQEKLAQIDLLSFQIQEIEQAQIKIGERENLAEQKKRLKNTQKIIENLSQVYAFLNGTDYEPGAVQQLESAEQALYNVTDLVEGSQTFIDETQSAKYTISELASSISDALYNTQDDPDRLLEIEERLDLIYRLSRKYGEDEQQILDFLDLAKEKLEKIEVTDELIAEIEREMEAVKEKLIALSRQLSEKRKKTAEEFKEQVSKQLEFLDMPRVEFCVLFEKTKLTSTGEDKIEFLISVNPGEAPKPLSKIASGGELSRIMLAIKSVLAGSDMIDTLIFDEIDTGVSGSAAQKIARKLQGLGSRRQVICVTHLAQIASFADTHLLIKKEVSDNKTFTQVENLDNDGRIDEIARIMGSENITELQRESAKEMLNIAASCKTDDILI